jgi:predicted AlkP superfamily phosphohydrolase/phosphomutase
LLDSSGDVMAPSVLALGLDAADPLLIERWMDAGYLPNLSRLRRQGVYARLQALDYCRAEASCATLLTGCHPDKHGMWTPTRFDPRDYGVREVSYDYREYPPFYALGREYRVAVFDMPQTVFSSDVNGIQVLGWGAHAPRTPSDSRPGGLFAELTTKYGAHPTLNRDHLPTIGDKRAIERLKSDFLIGIQRRGAICRDLIARDCWNLFLTYFGEIHSAQHFFWHISQPDHPLHPFFRQEEWDPLLEVFQAVDREIGAIVAAAPSDARVVIFSDHGMETNCTDLPSMVFLPELLYRASFPGVRGLHGGRAGSPPARMALPSPSWSWRSAVWAQKHDPNPITAFLRRRLPTVFFHYAIEKRLGDTRLPLCPDDCPMGSQPPMWYRPAWPRMMAFALPTFSEGYVRVNLRGREASGTVDPRDYDRVCDEVTAMLSAVTNARTGDPVVQRIVRTRRGPDDADPRRPDPDLIVLWRNAPTDVVDSPTLGRIGPLPFNRSGSHVHRGFLLAAGTGLPIGERLPDGQALDIAPTILRLVGAPIPAHFDGAPLLNAPLPASPAMA